MGYHGHHKYSKESFPTVAAMLAYFKSINCEFKELDFLLALAHLSRGLWEGGKFTQFECPDPDCRYKPTESQARADHAAFLGKTDEEQAQARSQHIECGAHWAVELYMGPMLTHGMRLAGCDQLHLVYLNMFKHMFKYTIHESLPLSEKKLVSRYLKAASFYSYDAADESDDPTKRWIGREVKRFLHEAPLYLPFLLRLSSGMIDVTDDTLERLNSDGEEEMDVSDDEFAGTADEIAVTASPTVLA